MDLIFNYFLKIKEFLENNTYKNIMGALIVFFSAPFFLEVIGLKWVPSLDWVSQINTVATIIGVVTAAWSFASAMCSEKEVTDWGKFTRVLTIIFSPIFFYFLARNATVVVVPMFFALVAGHEVELPFIVSDTDAGRRGCSDAIEIADQLILHEEICRIPLEIRRSLNAGDKVMVVGRGNDFGVFPKRVYRVE